MPPPSDNEFGALEEARKRLYTNEQAPGAPRAPLSRPPRSLSRAWQSSRPQEVTHLKRRHVRLASIFFAGALAFFIMALAVAGYLLYFGGNSVSANNISLSVEGPSTIAGGDTVPLTIAVTNRNPVAIDNVTIEMDFPEGTRSAEDVLKPLPIYSENLGSVKSGETVTRTVKAVVFGAAGETLTLPVSLSYDAQGSTSTFVKKSSYPLAISSTPLSVSVDTIAESTAGKPFTITLQVRSNATVPIENVTLAGTFPFGWSLLTSSIPLSGSSFSLGTLAPGASKTLILTGSLDGQNGERRVFHFSIGTAKSATATDFSINYMTQDASVMITAPFITTSLALNGSSLASAPLTPGQVQNVTLSYTNTLLTNVTDATITVALVGSAVDYTSIESTNGFYRSSDHSIVFSRDSDPTLASLAPGATGIGSFSFSTVPAAQFGRAPSVTFTTSVSGTRMGQSNVPEQISSTRTETVKATTAVLLTASSAHAGGPLTTSGPIPPVAETTTSYAIVWRVQDTGSAVADGTVTATLPSYVTYTGVTSGQGSINYDTKSRTVTWSVGSLSQGASAQTAFEVGLLPSTSQKGRIPSLTSAAAFSGYDRFAGVTVTASADTVTTETVGDSGYVPANATVQ